MMKRLKVLVSAYACNPLSSSRLHAGEDIKGWRFVEQISRFHEVWVITHSYNREGALEAQAQGKLPGVHFHFTNLPSWVWPVYKIGFAQRIYYYLWQILAWRVTKKLHTEFHFDVVHHISFGNDWIPSYIGALLPIHFIWGPLGGGQITPKGLMKEYSLLGRFSERSRSIAQWFGRKDYIRKRCMRRADAILVCNKETKEKISKKYEDKIFYFPLNGIFPSDLRQQVSNNTNRNVFRIVTAGRLHRLKGFALAIKSFYLFNQKYPDSEFVVVGKGPEHDRLQRLIKEMGLETRVKLMSWLSREDLLEMMHSSDVFVFPSFREGGGAVIVEAMATGRPVICLDAGGPGFHIRDEWGIKIEPKDPEYVTQQVAAAMEKLYLDDELRISMGEAALKRTKDYYLSDRLGERLLEIYKQVLPQNFQ